MIPKLTHVQHVYTSSSSPSVLSALKSGDLSPEEVKATMCMDESTVEMEGSRAVSEAIEETGAGMVDAPVSGGTFRQPFPRETISHPFSRSSLPLAPLLFLSLPLPPSRRIGRRLRRGTRHPHHHGRRLFPRQIRPRQTDARAHGQARHPLRRPRSRPCRQDM